MRSYRMKHLLKASRTPLVIAVFVLIFGGLGAAGLYVRGEYMKYGSMTNTPDTSTETGQADGTGMPIPDPSSESPATGAGANGSPDSSDIQANELNKVEDFSAGDLVETDTEGLTVVYQEGYNPPVLRPEDISAQEFTLDNVN